jgi:hypothetical protein
MKVKKNNSLQHDGMVPCNDSDTYAIKIKGRLDDHWKQWFEGLEFTFSKNGKTGEVFTIISGPIADQPALHGLLTKIRDLNLTLISVRKISQIAPKTQKGKLSGDDN